MDVVKVQHAKTHLSSLLVAVERGEEFVIARGDVPVARLVPIDGAGERELGFMTFELPDTFFDPLPDEEVAGWEGSA